MANKKVSQLTSKPSVLVTDLFPIADPSTGQLYKTTISDLGTAIGSGVSSVNGLVGAVVLDTDDIQELVSPTNKWFTDTRARAALSASSPLAYNSGTGVFSIPQATGSQNGFLSSSDWTTFNAKQAALSGTGFVKISGTTISYDNSTYLTTSAAASTYLALAGGTLTGALNGTSATFTGDLTISSGNPRLYFTDTDNNPDYFISNTDGTFTVYDVTNSTSRFTIGTTGNATFTNAIIGGGSITGTALYSTGIISAGTSISAQNAFFDNGSSASIIQFNQSGTLKARLYFNTPVNTLTLGTYNTGGNLRFEVDNNNPAVTIASTGITTFNYALSGTSATFSSTITSSRNDTGNISMTLSNAYINQGNLINFVHNSGGSTTNGYIGHGGDSSGNIVIINNGITALSLARASGAATFSSSVTAEGNIATKSGNSVVFYRPDNAIYTSLYDAGSGAGNGFILNNTNGEGFHFKNGANSIMRLAAGGNVGIGTTSPNELLTINNGTQANSFGLQINNNVNNTSGIGFAQYGSNSTYSYITADGRSTGYIRFSTNDTERMRITSSGNVGIGTTAPFSQGSGATTMELAGNTYGQFFVSANSASIRGVVMARASTLNDVYIASITNSPLLFGTNDTERMRITSGGTVSINTTAPNTDAVLFAKGRTSDGAGYAAGFVNSSGSTLMYLRNDGLFIAKGVYDFTTGGGANVSVDADGLVRRSTSSLKYKKNVETYSKGLNELMQLRAVTYNSNNEDETQKYAGLIAEEVHDLGLTEFVQYAKDGTPDALAYSNMVSLLVKGIQELKTENNSLLQRVQILENK
jgi:hypothetical protein